MSYWLKLFLSTPFSRAIFRARSFLFKVEAPGTLGTEAAGAAEAAATFFSEAAVATIAPAEAAMSELRSTSTTFLLF